MYKILIIGTFFDFSGLRKFLDLNSEIFEEDTELRLVATVNDMAFQQRCKIPSALEPRVHIINKKDRCYAEGWNNALDFCFNNLDIENNYIIFLGEGDKLIWNGKNFLPKQIEAVQVFDLWRGSACIRKLPLENMYFATIGAWTPACAIPAEYLFNYRFPIRYKIASDIDLFFYLKTRNTEFVFSNYYTVQMDDTGMSAENTVAVREYYKLYKDNYGFSLLAYIAMHLKILKVWLRRQKWLSQR